MFCAMWAPTRKPATTQVSVHGDQPTDDVERELLDGTVTLGLHGNDDCVSRGPRRVILLDAQTSVCDGIITLGYSASGKLSTSLSRARMTARDGEDKLLACPGAIDMISDR